MKSSFTSTEIRMILKKINETSSVYTPKSSLLMIITALRREIRRNIPDNLIDSNLKKGIEILLINNKFDAVDSDEILLNIQMKYPELNLRRK